MQQASSRTLAWDIPVDITQLEFLLIPKVLCALVLTGVVMTVTFKNADASIKKTHKKNGHTKAKSPIIDIYQPGRLRVSNLMAC